MRSSLRLGVALCALAALSPAASPPARASTSTAVPCAVMDVRIAAGLNVVACAGYQGDLLTVSLSRDGGRSWSMKSSSPQPPVREQLVSIVLPSNYSASREIFLQGRSLGMYSSVDDGATLRPVDVFGGSPNYDRATAVDDFYLGSSTLSAPAILMPNAGDSAALWRGQHVTVDGGGRQQDRAFLQVGTGPAAVVVNINQTYREPVEAAVCDRGATCRRTHVFDLGMSFTDIAVAAEGAPALGLLMVDAGNRPVVYVSADRGQTFVRSRNFDGVMKSLAKGGFAVIGRSIAVGDGGRTVAVAVNNRLVITTNGGASWTQRATPVAVARLMLGSGRRLLIASTNSGHYCSADFGQRWLRRCP